MISALKNEEGFIYAYCEWWIVNEEGINSNQGNYLYIKDLWIHPKRRLDGTLKNLVWQIDQDEKNCQFVYWNNLKHNRITPTYDREQFRRMIWAAETQHQHHKK